MRLTWGLEVLAWLYFMSENAMQAVVIHSCIKSSSKHLPSVGAHESFLIVLFLLLFFLMWDADWLQLHVPTLILPETLLKSVQNGIL